MDYQPQMGDIVIYRQPTGDANPAIIVKVLSSTTAILGYFVIGGMVGGRKPIEHGDQQGQWQTKEEYYQERSKNNE
jgi:hypothetical protein